MSTPKTNIRISQKIFGFIALLVAVANSYEIVNHGGLIHYLLFLIGCFDFVQYCRLDQGRIRTKNKEECVEKREKKIVLKSPPLLLLIRNVCSQIFKR